MQFLLTLKKREAGGENNKEKVIHVLFFSCGIDEKREGKKKKQEFAQRRTIFGLFSYDLFLPMTSDSLQGNVKHLRGKHQFSPESCKIINSEPR